MEKMDHIIILTRYMMKHFKKNNIYGKVTYISMVLPFPNDSKHFILNDSEHRNILTRSMEERDHKITTTYMKELRTFQWYYHFYEHF